MKRMKIAVSGKSGCGNTTVSRLVADRLNLKFVNFTFRSLAEETGITLRDILDIAGKDDSWDREVDRRQLELARSGEGCVLGTRLAIWMLGEANLKVYLYADAETRAARILKREGGTLESVMAFTAERDRQDRARFLKIYGIDNDEYGFADLIVDTGRFGPEEIAEMIIERAGGLGKNRTKT